MESDDMNEDANIAAEHALGLEYNAELARQAGGLLEIDQVMDILGLTSPDQVYQAVKDSRLLCVQDGPLKRYPTFQFVNGEVLPGVAAILSAIPNTEGWDVLNYLFKLEEGVGVILPVDLIRMGPEGIAKAVRFATRLEG